MVKYSLNTQGILRAEHKGFPGRAILEELILHIALAAGTIFPSSTGIIQTNIDPALLGLYGPI